jgi:phage terminase Nu1 subunit (DNA packaging protein)
MANENEISIREFARRIHVSEGAVRKAIKEKKIVAGFDEKKGKILFVQAYAEYGQSKTAPKAGHGVSKAKVAEKLTAMQGATVAAGDDDDLPEDVAEYKHLSVSELIEKINVHDKLEYSETLRLDMILAIAKEKMKLEEMQGTLVKKADIDKQLFALGNELKLKLQNIPNRCVALVRSAANDVESSNILLKEINQVIESFINNI